MADRGGIQKELRLKNPVFDDYFDGKKFSWEQEVDHIDFIITAKKARIRERCDFFSEGPRSSRYYFWSEAKKGIRGALNLYIQLVLNSSNHG